MNTPPVDFTFVYELSENDTRYIYEVLSLFLTTVPEKLTELEKLVPKEENYEKIAEIAHFLKSSSSVINVRDMYANLAQIEALARSKTGLKEIQERFAQVVSNFSEAVPLIIAEKQKNKTS